MNNAISRNAIKRSDQIPTDDFHRVLAIKTGQMLKQEKLYHSYRSYPSSIVTFASMYGLVTLRLNVPATAHATSKHAVIGLVRSDALAFVHQDHRHSSEPRRDTAAMQHVEKGGGRKSNGWKSPSIGT